MARYIDVEAFKQKLIDEKSFFPAIVARALDEMPTADVVPKSEVEKLETENLILKQKRLTLFDRLEFVEMARVKGAIEVIEYLENEGLLNMTPQGIAELKKKYTEGEE